MKPTPSSSFQYALFFAMPYLILLLTPIIAGYRAGEWMGWWK